MASYNPFGGVSVSSIVGHIVSQASKAIECVLPERLAVGNGRSALKYEVSVGIGRGATRLALGGEEVSDFLSAIRGFNPAVSAEAMTPAEVVRRTIQVEGDEVTFRVSNAKNARQVSVPVKEWSAFVAHMGEVDGWLDGAVAHFRNVSE
jgi:hypothetical protein